MQYVRGVGPRRAVQLAELGIRTVRDLIDHFPFRYGVETPSEPIAQILPGETPTVIGTLTDVRVPRRSRRAPLVGLIEDDSGELIVRWFESAYLLEKLNLGDRLRLVGKVTLHDGYPAMVNPRMEWVTDETQREDRTKRFEPVYHAGGEVTSRQIGTWVAAALPRVAEALGEFYPREWLRERKLATRRGAYERIHQPRRDGDAETARRRLAYDELLLGQLAAALKRRQRTQSTNGVPIQVTPEVDRRIRGRLKFAFTAAQNRVVREIAADLGRPAPMNRLLQGDVGAGKTAVAVYAALAVIAGGHQAVIMAPTETLARQHFANVQHYLAGARVRTALVVGGSSKTERERLRRRIALGEVDLAVGTHALLERDVRFPSLGLVVIDEQHKFGVRQRMVLRRKGREPHYLVMSATPIPRSLAMTAFGDLDVSILDELPPGRRPVQTRIVRREQTGEAWQFVRERLAAGRQAYIVYPLVEESDALPLRAATREAQELEAGALRGFRVGLLHGRMRAEEKAEVMRAFASGRVQALVSTTVIEVGVDVPNATVMVVQHAERYGLSQLHQLRGRIGRGEHGGVCLLMSDARGEGAMRRLGVLARTQDGFVIAEEDLRQRGPGELLGARQHGDAGLRVARLPDDFDLLRLARRDAETIAAAKGGLLRAEHAALRAELLRRYRGVTALLDAG